MSYSRRFNSRLRSRDGARKPRPTRQRTYTYRQSHSGPRVLTVGLLAVAAVAMFGTQPADAATAVVNLASASSFAVIAGSTITNTGSSVIAGDSGLSPGSSITGFPPGVQSTGATHVDDAVALQAQADTTTAYLDAAGRTPFTVVPADLNGMTLVGGVYEAASSMALSGTLTLNGGGDANSVFIFLAGSTLTTASGSTVALENGAQACNVFWQVGSSATIGTTSDFVGTILALTSATLDTGASVDGRVLARNGAVTLDDNAVSLATCSAAPTTTTTLAAPTTTTTLASPTTTTTLVPITTSATTTTTRPPVATTTTGPRPPTPTTLVPVGAPATGDGGTARTGLSLRVPIGIGALAIAGVTGTIATRGRRRRVGNSPGSSVDDNDES